MEREGIRSGAPLSRRLEASDYRQPWSLAISRKSSKRGVTAAGPYSLWSGFGDDLFVGDGKFLPIERSCLLHFGMWH